MSLSPVFPIKWKLDLRDWLDYSKLFWQEYLIDVAMYFILHYMRGHVKSGCLILSMLRLITWLRGWQPNLSIVRLWVVIFCFSLEQVMCRWVYSANFDQVKSYSFWCSKYVLTLASRISSKLIPMPFYYKPISIGKFPCLLAQGGPGLRYRIFLIPDLELAISPGALIPFSEHWCLETKIGMLGLFGWFFGWFLKK